VEMRALTTRLCPERKQYPHAWPLTWTLVEVWEPTPAPACEALHWLLWTREPATTLVEVQEVVRKYTCRWPIEAYHLTLKSGCRIEALRLEKWTVWKRQSRCTPAWLHALSRCGTGRHRSRTPRPRYCSVRTNAPSWWPSLPQGKRCCGSHSGKRCCGSVVSAVTSIVRGTECLACEPCGVACV